MQGAGIAAGERGFAGRVWGFCHGVAFYVHPAPMRSESMPWKPESWRKPKEIKAGWVPTL